MAEPVTDELTDDAVLVAVDFTADTLRLALTERSGTPIVRDQWELPGLADEEAWAWEVGGRLATLFAREGNQRSALGIGIAAPGPVDPDSGTLIGDVAGQPGWHGLRLVDAMRRHIDAPVVAEHRTISALLGERREGAARRAGHVLYVSLRGIPTAAAISAGRVLRGARWGAGALPAVPELDPQAALADHQLETVAGLLADATALLDPALVVIEAAEPHLDPLLPLLQRVIDEVAPGPHVVRAELGEGAALAGAVGLASTVAYEGELTA